MTRQAKQQPATAYDYRRSIELVQVLALDGDKGLLALCEAWHIEPVRYEWHGYTLESQDPNRIGKVHYLATIRALAKAAIEYQRKESE